MPEQKIKTKKDAKSVWKAVTAELQLTLSEYIYKTWVVQAYAQNLTETSIEIVCANDYIKNLVEKNYRSLIQQSVNKAGEGEYELVFRVGTPKESPRNTQENPQNMGPLFQDEKETHKKLKENGLNPEYTLENFVTGNSNQLAYSIALSIAQDPGGNYNPVFYYSGVGLGKTHLLQAIGNHITKTKPNLKILYTTGEAFTNELIETIQGRKNKYTSNKFRSKYRNVDILLLDDIQFIIGKEATQEEFFHTFNTLHLAKKQIVLTSDRPPNEFKNLEKRITSRFGSGIIVDMQTPDFETRTAILRNKRDRNSDDVSNDILNLIAQRVDTNVRELEGAYLQVLTFSKVTGQRLTKELTADILGQNLVEEKKKPINVNEILKAVCAYYSVTNKQIKGRRRTKEVVIPRQVAMYLIQEFTELPLMTIGELLGGRDHTTIMHGVDKVKQEINSSTRTKQDVLNVKQIIGQM